MRRTWKPLLTLLLLVSGVMWLFQARFTPVAAVRSISFVRGEHLQTVTFPGGAGVLLKHGQVYHAYAACRWGLLLWRPCGGTSLSQLESNEPVIEDASWNAGDNEGWGISILVGHVRDERIDRIVWGDEEQAISGDRHFFFARRTHRDGMFERATARSKAGQELYEWSGATYYAWRPVLPPMTE